MTKELNTGEPVGNGSSIYEPLLKIIEGGKVEFKFPTMLRKMWSGSEVKAWLDELPPLYSQGCINQLKAEIERLKRGNEATAKLNHQKGYEIGSALTTYNKPAMETLQAEVEALKATVNDARNVIQNIVFGDRKPFDMDGWAQVPWIAIAKGAEFLGSTQAHEEYKPLTEADAPFQKVAPKELSETIDGALGINRGEPAANTEDTAECHYCYGAGAQTERFSIQNHMEAAVRILTQLGFSQEASREYGADERRDRVVDILGRYFPAKWVDKDGNIFYTETLAHTLPLYKHKESEGLIRTTTLTERAAEATKRMLSLEANTKLHQEQWPDSEVSPQELAALLRFKETLEDGEGYDIPKEMIQRLGLIGLICRTSRGGYTTTFFGDWVMMHAAAKAQPKGA